MITASEYFSTLATVLIKTFWLALTGMLIGGFIFLCAPALIPGAAFALAAIPIAATALAFMVTIPFGEFAIIASIMAGSGAYAGVAALATCASAPFLIPFLSLLSITLAAGMLLGAISNALKPSPTVAVAASEEPANEDVAAELEQPVPEPAPALNSSAQVSQALNIQVPLNAGNIGEVSQALQHHAVDEEKSVPAVENPRVYAFPAMS